MFSGYIPGMLSDKSEWGHPAWRDGPGELVESPHHLVTAAPQDPQRRDAIIVTTELPVKFQNDWKSLNWISQFHKILL